MKKLDILIADDHSLVLEGFLYVVKSFPFVESVQGVSNGKEVMSYLVNHRPDLILMDLDMPEMDGIDTSEAVLGKYPDVKVVILSGYNEEDIIYRTIELGVHGYLHKEIQPEELKKAIVDVMTNGFYYNQAVVKVMRGGIIKESNRQNHFPKKDITSREKKLLKLLCQEKTNKEIAEEMYLSDRTIEKMRKSLATKLEVKGTVGLVKYAIKNGLDL